MTKTGSVRSMQKSSSVRSMPPQYASALALQDFNNRIPRTPDFPIDFTGKIPMTPENIKPLLESAKRVQVRLRECIEEVRGLLEVYS